MHVPITCSCYCVTLSSYWHLGVLSKVLEPSRQLNTLEYSPL